VVVLHILNLKKNMYGLIGSVMMNFTATETGAGRYFGLGRIDLSQIVNELQPAYAPDIMVADTYYNNAYSTSVTVDCLCLFNKKLYFGTNYAGVFGETSVYATNGYLKTRQN